LKLDSALRNTNSCVSSTSTTEDGGRTFFISAALYGVKFQKIFTQKNSSKEKAACGFEAVCNFFSYDESMGGGGWVCLSEKFQTVANHSEKFPSSCSKSREQPVFFSETRRTALPKRQ